MSFAQLKRRVILRVFKPASGWTGQGVSVPRSETMFGFWNRTLNLRYEYEISGLSGKVGLSALRAGRIFPPPENPALDARLSTILQHEV
jgi:hypothetical protein